MFANMLRKTDSQVGQHQNIVKYIKLIKNCQTSKKANILQTSGQHMANMEGI